MKNILTLNYQNYSYKLINGDITEQIESLPEKSIDLILTDPPYGITDAAWDTIIPITFIKKLFEKVRKSDRTPMLLFGAEPFSSLLRTGGGKIPYKYDWIWVKEIATNFLNAKRQPLRNTENISVFYSKQCLYNPQWSYSTPYKSIHKKGKLSSLYTFNAKTEHVTCSDGRRFPKTTLFFDTEKHTKDGLLHPTQKPIKLLEYLIRTYTNPGDTVLDFTAGVNSTGIACLRTGRNYIGIEKDRTFFEISIDRFKKEIAYLSISC